MRLCETHRIYNVPLGLPKSEHVVPHGGAVWEGLIAETGPYGQVTLVLVSGLLPLFLVHEFWGLSQHALLPHSHCAFSAPRSCSSLRLPVSGILFTVTK